MEEPWLDKSTLEKWLKVPVKEVHSEDSSTKGDNFLSDMKRLEVKTENGQVFPLVVKCRIEEGVTADIVKESSAFRREQEIYSSILSRMSQLLRDKFPDSFDEFAPKCYYTCKSFLVLEDLKASGFKMEDKRKGLDLDQCLLVMHTLAKFHASSVILHQQNPGIFKIFEPSYFVEDAILESIERFWKGMSRTLADELDSWGEEWHKYAVKVRGLTENLMDRVEDVTRRRDTDFNVLLHGDVWTNNIMFRNRTEGIRFLDFQMAHYSSPALDFYYFLTTSASLEVRREHRDRLIEEYHKTLCKTLTDLGYKQKLITMEELNREIDKKAFYGVITLLGPYALMQTQPDCDFSFDEALATGRNAGSAMYGEIYKQVVKVLLPLYDSKGAFDVNK